MIDLHSTLYYNFDQQIESAYIIRLSNNESSQTLSKRCADSCDSVGMQWKFHEAVDGTTGKLVVPEQYANQNWIKWLKYTGKNMTTSETGCASSHISLWAHCIEIDKPIVILEHDALMVQPYKWHHVRNSVCYLGNTEQSTQMTVNDRVIGTPPMPGETHNGRHMGGCHAYAIDPMVANRLMMQVLDHGIDEPVDLMMKNSKTCIMQIGFYAYQMQGQTTLSRRDHIMPL